MLPIVQTKLAPLIINTIIGPHGITDAIHAIHTHKQKELAITYTSCISSAHLLDTFHQTELLNVLFLVASAIHFRNDIPIKNNNLQLLISSLMVFNAENIGMPFFLTYMTLIHVPNHYITFHNITKQYKALTLFSISLISLIMFCFQNNNQQVDPHIISLVKGLIISHVVYEEKYSNEPHQNILQNK